MFVTHFYEGKTSVLSQLLVNLPAVEENIKIKGRKAKIIEVNQINNNNYQVRIVFEIIPKKQPIKELGKKKKIAFYSLRNNAIVDKCNDSVLKFF